MYANERKGVDARGVSDHRGTMLSSLFFLRTIGEDNLLERVNASGVLLVLPGTVYASDVVARLRLLALAKPPFPPFAGICSFLGIRR